MLLRRRATLLSAVGVLGVASSLVLTGPAWADTPVDYSAVDLNPAEQAISRTMIQSVWPETEIDSAFAAAGEGTLIAGAGALAVGVFGGVAIGGAVLYLAYKAGSHTAKAVGYSPCGSGDPVCVSAYNLGNQEVTYHAGGPLQNSYSGFTATGGTMYTLFSDGLTSDPFQETVRSDFPDESFPWEINTCATAPQQACVANGVDQSRGSGTDVHAVRTWWIGGGQTLSWPNSQAEAGLADSTCIGANGAGKTDVYQGFSPAATDAAVSIPVPDCPAGTHRIGYNATDDTDGTQTGMVTTTFPSEITDPNATDAPCLYRTGDVPCVVAPTTGGGCHWGPYVVAGGACTQSPVTDPEALPTTGPNGDPVTGSPTITGDPDPRKRPGGTGSPDGDPATGSTPNPGPSTSPGATPGPTSTAGPTSTPTPAPTSTPADVNVKSLPNDGTATSSCDSGGWGWNPIHWVEKPVECALQTMFLPSSAEVSAAVDTMTQTLKGSAPWSYILTGPAFLHPVVAAFGSSGDSCTNGPTGPADANGLPNLSGVDPWCALASGAGAGGFTVQTMRDVAEAGIVIAFLWACYHRAKRLIGDVGPNDPSAAVVNMADFEADMSSGWADVPGGTPEEDIDSYNWGGK